jgi:hypothetical protein
MLRGRWQSHSGAACGGTSRQGWLGSRGARLLAMTAHCAAAAQPWGAGSTALVAEPLAMALRYAGQSSDFLSCTLPSRGVLMPRVFRLRRCEREWP